ncbi:UTRA domain-containing protein [Streptomyces sp. NPDC059649]|uniref:UTRA domain-containing protein n=1 Tax=Streptomyces sp. NPDC059649 TaxID=3346895 RepID=UPI003697661A
MRALIAPDRDWPYQAERIASGAWKAGEQLAERLGAPVGATLNHEVLECLDPGGRSALIACSWWRGRRRPHASYVAEVEVMHLDETQAHALGLTVDSPAYRLVRTRLDEAGRPVETADLILPMDRWTIRL